LVTAEELQHRAAVSAWLARVAPDGSLDSLLRAVDETFAALWQRSLLTLGEVMLTAIVERVLYTATEQYPVLAAVEAGPAGLRFEALRARGEPRAEDVSAAVELVLVEFLTVLGNLTAQILTPALHAQLSKGKAS
jgi:hypothetical protein